MDQEKGPSVVTDPSRRRPGESFQVWSWRVWWDLIRGTDLDPRVKDVDDRMNTGEWRRAQDSNL
jgi:hypothetical protein